MNISCNVLFEPSEVGGHKLFELQTMKIYAKVSKTNQLNAAQIINS